MFLMKLWSTTKRNCQRFYLYKVHPEQNFKKNLMSNLCILFNVTDRDAS